MSRRPSVRMPVHPDFRKALKITAAKEGMFMLDYSKKLADRLLSKPEVPKIDMSIKVKPKKVNKTRFDFRL
jgi:hypothetical protein